MTLGDDVMRVVPDLRSAAESMMVDKGVIARSSGTSGTIHPDTGMYTPGNATAVYSGPCRVRKPTLVDQDVVFGDRDVTVTRYVVTLPHTAALIAVGDVFTVTESADAEIVAVPTRITAIVARSVLLYRQLGVEVIE